MQPPSPSPSPGSSPSNAASRPPAVRCVIDFADPQSPSSPNEGRLRYVFDTAPRQILTATRLDQVRDCIEQVQAAACGGAWVLGYVGYEAAPALDAALCVVQSDPPTPESPLPLPLAWFAVYDPPSHDAAYFAHNEGDSAPCLSLSTSTSLNYERFEAALQTIQSGIAQGAFYQVNYTAPLLQGPLQTGTPRALFDALQRAQPGGYAALLDSSAFSVLSVSPELFFDWRCDAQGCGPILTRPMKGTAARGDTPQHDAQQAAQLQRSAKERAENVMIVDLLRNDLSRIAHPHSVQVTRLFHTEALPTVWQMTSDIQAQTRPGTRLVDVFAALFPCGSVTGAPKVQAMRAIAALETQPRGVYCGALGLVRPHAAGGLAATFNVPIRTLQLQGSQVRYSVGSGIVWGADPQAEWREWQAKCAVVERASAPFELLETMKLLDGALPHGDLHWQRLHGAAQHFGFPWQPERIDAALQTLVAQYPCGAWRVRWLLNAQGEVQAQAFPLTATSEPVRLALATRPLSEAHSEFVRYKTTRRAHYAAFAPAPGSGLFDTILYNSAGQVTESTFGNVAALLEGRWITPPLSCGLLPGIGRALALQQGRVVEQVLRVREDVPRVQAWAFVNSLRGWLSAERVNLEGHADHAGQPD